MYENKNDPRLNSLLNAVDHCRGLVVDSVEFEFGDDPRWPPLRSRILKAFGDRGLELRVKEIMGIKKRFDVMGGGK